MQISTTLPSLLAFILATNYITFLLTYIITRHEAIKASQVNQSKRVKHQK